MEINIFAGYLCFCRIARKMRGMKLKQYMIDNNLTEADLAKKLKRHRSIIGKYCAEKVTPTLKMALRIEKITKGAVTAQDWT
jgi:plasmid maintenance system antidote protein VapI